MEYINFAYIPDRTKETIVLGYQAFYSAIDIPASLHQPMQPLMTVVDVLSAKLYLLNKIVNERRRKRINDAEKIIDTVLSSTPTYFYNGKKYYKIDDLNKIYLTKSLGSILNRVTPPTPPTSLPLTSLPPTPIPSKETYSIGNTDYTIDELIRKYEPLVCSSAWRFIDLFPPSYEIQDLEQIARLALLTAAEQYDPNKGVSFTSYARNKIKYNLLNKLNDERFGRRSKFYPHWLLDKVKENLKRRLGRQPSIEELAEEYGTSVKRCQEILETGPICMTSMDQPLREPYMGTIRNRGRIRNLHNLLSSEVSDVVDEIDNSEVTWKLNNILNTRKNLSSRERFVIISYYYDDMTLKDIGDKLNISGEGVRRIKKNAEMKLKDVFDKHL